MEVLPVPKLTGESMIEISLLGVLGEEDLRLLSSLDEEDSTSDSDNLDLGDPSRKRKKALTSTERRYSFGSAS